ncbi:nucleotidyltransferase substrate binding protein [Patescibacteria group bacterium]|nr:nucleotidyltransferase substrate binding protein [Patescibacteria group bacterium]MCG2702510.1 nucleotidyltransferase substrate binding protein [Candidatus Parcubacteria bacterium]MBU4264563.1 nucleotidyltransferase substrate binding protein [Patescibacteria group bacterium]MBU4390231.1 nucleotidyltransferase substrate binding protein [Patescibacteria group bacterium]MBU4397223.1 nucleotidyltransferase substrate binding protein [Patescibacteria group bacterium]
MGLKDKIEKQKESFVKAIGRLEDALKEEKNEFVRDSVVCRFEFSFKLGWKLMKMVLNYLGREDCNSPRESIIISAQVKLIDNPEKWLDYLEVRNLSVHMYSENTAEEVYKLAGEFVEDARKLERVAEERLS